MATTQKDQPDRSDRSKQRSPGISGDESRAQRDYKDRETRGEDSQAQDAFNENRQDARRETFNGNDDESEQSIDGKTPKMSIAEDNDDNDVEGDEEAVIEVDYENIDEENTNPGNTDHEEEDGSDPIPGKD